jgi:hypothetical protein
MVIFASLVWAESSSAATVVIIAPSVNAPLGMTETAARIRGELLSAGFVVEILGGATAEGMIDVQSRESLERLAQQRGADAVIAIVGDAMPNLVAVWVGDKATGKSVVRKLPFEPKSGHAPETLAIRAVELLRSSFLEIDLTATGHRAPSGTASPPTAVHVVEQGVEQGVLKDRRRRELLGVELGGAASVGFDGVGLALLPLVRFNWALRPWFLAQAALAGLGTRPSIENATGSAQLSQQFVVLGACIRSREGRGLRPFATLSAGALHTSVVGRVNLADHGLEGRDEESWSFLLDGSLGTALSLRDRLYLTVALHAQLAEPYPAVHFLDTVVATSAHPNLLLTLSVGAWL